MSLKAGHRAYHFQAHRVGFVTAMRRTSHGHLWTGSSRGNLRWVGGWVPGWGVAVGCRALLSVQCWA
jgi:hypothetical protein